MNDQHSRHSHSPDVACALCMKPVRRWHEPLTMEQAALWASLMSTPQQTHAAWGAAMLGHRYGRVK